MTKLGVPYLLIGLLAFGACSQPKPAEDNSNTNELPIYQRMAASEIQRNPDPRLLDFRDKPKWEYTNGLECLAIFKVWKKTGDDAFYNYVSSFADSMVNEDASIDTYKLSDYNIDRVNPGRLLLELYKVDPKPKYRMAIDTLRKQLRNQPRNSEGGFWHKKIYPYQMWLDGLYMGSPFLTQYGATFNEPEVFDDVANQIRVVTKYTYNADKKLFYHAYDESKEMPWADPVTGQSPHFWGRAMGWYAMALVDVLDYFPTDHPARPEILEVVNKMAEGIATAQDQETGVWWQILDKPNEKDNYLEASCSSMFVYFLSKARLNGYIDSSYTEVLNKGYQGILDQFIKENEDGTVSLTNVCAVAGLGGNPYRDGSYEYYVGEPKRDNDPKGVGPFMMAALLMEQLKTENK